MNEVQSSPSLQIDLENHSPDEAIGRLLEHAATADLSDLFFTANEKHFDVLGRHFGILRQLSTLPSDMGRRCITHFKKLAGMDVTEYLRPQDGRWISRKNGRVIDVRLNIIPTIHGEDLALRLLLRDSHLLDIDALGLAPRDLNQVLGLSNSPSGLILVTGPTGAGKTTTLYACLKYLNSGNRKIHTIEDPIDYVLPGIRQSQVNPGVGVGFADLLRSVLRQGPDVIMIGEVRDSETAEIAVQAANSGHLVLTTLHAPTASGAIESMLSLGVKPSFLASSLRGVIAQRLVRTLCPACKVVFDLDDAAMIFDDVRPRLQPDEGKVLHGPGKCDACSQTGYAGRTGVFEVLMLSRELRRLIAERRPTYEIHQQAVAEGLIQCRQTALLKVARGETSVDEVMRAIPPEHLGLEN